MCLLESDVFCVWERENVYRNFTRRVLIKFRAGLLFGYMMPGIFWTILTLFSIFNRFSSFILISKLSFSRLYTRYSYIFRTQSTYKSDRPEVVASGGKKGLKNRVIRRLSTLVRSSDLHLQCYIMPVGIKELEKRHFARTYKITGLRKIPYTNQFVRYIYIYKCADI